MKWHIKKFDELTLNELYNILKERTNIFVVEQNCPYPEIDGKDTQCFHLFAEENGDIVAYLRILPPGVSFQEMALGRVIVKKEYRGLGLGKELLRRGIEFAEKEMKEQKIKIAAQQYLTKFYGSFGFKVASETYLEDGIPHVNMIYKK